MAMVSVPLPLGVSSDGEIHAIDADSGSLCAMVARGGLTPLTTLSPGSAGGFVEPRCVACAFLLTSELAGDF